MTDIPQYLGNQYILEFYNCDVNMLDDASQLEKVMHQAALEAGATVVKQFFHKFTPQGVSGTIVLAESHLNIHTWPEYGFAAIDIFTCGENLYPEKSMAYLKSQLKSKHEVLHSLKRGQDIRAHLAAHDQPAKSDA